MYGGDEGASTMTKVVLSVDFKAVELSRDEVWVLLGIVRRRLRQESRRRNKPDRAAKRTAATDVGIPDIALKTVTRLRRLEDKLLAVLDV